MLSAHSVQGVVRRFFLLRFLGLQLSLHVGGGDAGDCSHSRDPKCILSDLLPVPPPSSRGLTVMISHVSRLEQSSPEVVCMVDLHFIHHLNSFNHACIMYMNLICLHVESLLTEVFSLRPFSKLFDVFEKCRET